MMKIKQLLSMALLICSIGVTAQVTVYHNINGYTIATHTDPNDNSQFYRWQRFSSIAFKQGKILETSNVDLRGKYAKATLLDGKGKVMLPGLIDAHGHVINLGFGRLEVDVRGLGSAVETAQAVQQYAKQHPQLDWIKGRGWNQELWASRKFPNLKDMDEYVSDKPVWLTRVDGHAGWANRKALAFANINKDTLDPDVQR